MTRAWHQDWGGYGRRRQRTVVRRASARVDRCGQAAPTLGRWLLDSRCALVVDRQMAVHDPDALTKFAELHSDRLLLLLSAEHCTGSGPRLAVLQLVQIIKRRDLAVHPNGSAGGDGEQGTHRLVVAMTGRDRDAHVAGG